MKWVMVLDIGTTQIKGFAYELETEKKILEYKKTTPIKLPEPGHVEQDPIKLWEATQSVMGYLIEELGRPVSIGITTQRSSTVVWDSKSGEPLHNIITWQDTRAAELAEKYSKLLPLKFARGLGKFVSIFAPKPKSRGLIYMVTLANFKFGPNQPIMQLKWLLENIEEVKNAAKNETLKFGTIDTWIIYKLTKKHITDYTNASATGMFDPFYLKWSDRLTKMVGIPKKALPQIVDNIVEIEGTKETYETPITAIIADQQSALYSAVGTAKGKAKITLGTGGFMDLNLGENPAPACCGTYPMIYLKAGKTVLYLIEGIIQSVGSVFDLLREWGLFQNYEELYELEVEDCETIFIPTIAGLGTPHWNPNAKGTITEITRKTTKKQLISAAIHGLAYRFLEVTTAIELASQTRIGEIYADGNASKITPLLQEMANYTQKTIIQLEDPEGTARGAYLLARAKPLKLNIQNTHTPPKPKNILQPQTNRTKCKQKHKKHQQNKP